LTVDQYRTLLKVLDDQTEIEFFYQLNLIIQKNLISDFDINNLTTIDRFIIAVFLKMYSCSPYIELSRECDKCKTKTTINLNLNQLIPALAPKIDKKFETQVSYKMYDCQIDIPSIKTEYDIFEHSLIRNEDKHSFDNIYDNYILSHIKSLTINGHVVYFNVMDLMSKKQIFQKLPAPLIDLIKKEFLTPLHESLSDISFIDMSCPECKEKFDLKFQINFISDLIKIIFKDNSVNSVLMDLYNLSSAAHINSEFLMKISPAEMNTLVTFAKEANSQKDHKDPKQIDLFESPSEFT
jgi:hypothetical protein